MMLVHTVYEMYKIDWLTRISTEQRIASYAEWYRAAISGETYGCYESWLEEAGFDGEIYACFNEFCEAELLDREYMTSLVGGDDALMKDLEIYWKSLE